MDISLIRTFIEVAASGSFVHAAERLFVTQSAVSLRIKRLESSLGIPLFSRSKSGAVLTPAGQEFESYALIMLKIWEEARQQIALPPGCSAQINIAAQYSLWPRLAFRWIDEMRLMMPGLSIRGDIGMPDRITRMLIEGRVQAALLYTPNLRPGLVATSLMSEDLVLVASRPDARLDNIRDRYVFMDWGSEFIHAHALHLPDLTNPGLTMAIGALGAEFIKNRDFAAYLPARYVKLYIDEGALFYVPDAPVFPYPIWYVRREDLAPDIAYTAGQALNKVVEGLLMQQNDIEQELTQINEGHVLGFLGDV